MQRPAGGLTVALLGPVRIGLAGEQMAPVGQQLLRVLTGMLALAAGRAVSVPVLIDGLWGEDPTPGREKNLHSRVSALRRLLEGAEPGRGGSRVVRSGDCYLLRLDPGCLDVQEFTALAERARGTARVGDTAGAAGLFREALALWRGPALQDAAPWCPRLAGEAARLEEARAAVAEERIECDLALGRHGEAVTEIASLAEAFPLRERLAGQLMVALWRCGRRGDALAAYDRTRRVLATELGLDPGPELRRLHAQLLGDDPSLAAPAPQKGPFPAAGPAQGTIPAPVASFAGRQAELTEPDKLAGKHVRNMYLDSGPALHSAYLEQVGRIAPVQLHDRDTELAELAAFCTEPGRGPYAWWRAPAWAGKTALMSWFVLHPPPRVQVVSFFVTARYKGQDNRDAFIYEVMAQLADLLEQPVPTYLPEDRRELYLLRMVDQAVKKCRRLVLVVDGLDEDRGVTTGPDAYSIAALLPSRPPAGLLIIVAGRPDPPIPADVPDDHPLRDPAIVRVLARSRSADVVRADMQRELKRLLHGDQAQRDLLGLVAAAGGGLSAEDLAELTELPLYEIEENLRAVAGRTFTRRASHWQPDTTPSVYVLGHEELQTAATAFLGQVTLKEYRERLHAWADGYRRRGWPAKTPQYLLRGYFRLLRDSADIPRLIACAVDQVRHDRMLDITGGDTAALAEITDAQDLLLHLEEPDLQALARLNVHRSSIAERNAHVPPILPTAWAMTGNLERAEALARAITGPNQQAQALAGLAKIAAGMGDLDRATTLAQSITDRSQQARTLAALTEAAVRAGDLDRAWALADRAEAVAQAITDPSQQAQALAALARAAGAGDLDRAEALTQKIGEASQQAQALAALARAAAGAGDVDRAKALANRAEAVAETTNLYQRARALAVAAEAMAEAGDLDRAEARAQKIPEEFQQAEAVAMLVKAAAGAGDLDRAEALARKITRRPEQALALAALAKAAAEAGDLDRAEALARKITRRPEQALALAALAKAAAGAGDLHRAKATAQRAEALTASIEEASKWAQVLAMLWEAAAGAGDLDWAKALAERVVVTAQATAERSRQAQALAALAEAAAAAGDPALGEALTQRITDPEQPAQRLAALAKASAGAGDLDRPRALAEWAEMAARTITNPDQRSQMLAVLAKAAAGAGDIDRAEAAARAITDPDLRARILAVLAEAAARAGDRDRAAALADQATTAALAIASLVQRVRMLALLAEAAARAGDPGRARALVEQGTEAAGQVSLSRSQRGLILAVLAEAAMEFGDLDRAEALAHTITDAYFQASVLTVLAKVTAEAGNLDRAEAAARAIIAPQPRASALAALVKAAAAAGDLDRAEALAVIDASQQAQVLALLAEATLADEPDRAKEAVQRAEALAQAINDPDQRAQALAALVKAAAQVGDPDRAKALVIQAEAAARTVTSPSRRAQVLTVLAEAAARAGDLDRAKALVIQAEAAVLAIGYPFHRERALVMLAAAAMMARDLNRARAAALAITDPYRGKQVRAALLKAEGAGDLDQSEALAVTDPDQRARVLTVLAEAAAGAGDLDRAKAAVQRAHALAQRIPKPDQRAEALIALVKAAAGAGDLDRAEALAIQAEVAVLAIDDQSRREQVLAILAEAAAGAGDPERAEALAQTTTDPSQRVKVLAMLVETAARAGDLDRAKALAVEAEAVAHTIRKPDQQARTLANLATRVEPNQARSLLAQALTVGHWEASVVVLAQINPAAVRAIADEYLSLVSASLWGSKAGHS